jgi:hypothetical protein
VNVPAAASLGSPMQSLLAIGVLCFAAQTPPNEGLRAALEAMRNGEPGDASFEAALPRLPELLRSGSSAFVEGAAYLAGIHGRAECAEELVDALRRENERPPDGSSAPTRALLDALVQLDHAAPADVLLARPDPELATVLYLALSCEGDPASASSSLVRFVELGWCAEPSYWAASIELTVARDPRIAAHAFGGDVWELQIGVRDPGSADEVPYALQGGYWGTSHATWPPRVQYQLKLPEPDAPLDDIEFTRKEYVRSGPEPRRLSTHHRIEWRGRLLRELAPSSPELDLAAATAYVESIDRRALEIAIREHVARARAVLAAAAEELARAKLLPDAATAASALRLSVELVDLRSDVSVPLPDLGEVGGAEVRLR